MKPGVRAVKGVGLLLGQPWWVWLIGAFTFLAVYICRVVTVYRLSSKALDKVAADRVPEIINAVTDYHAEADESSAMVTGGRRGRAGVRGTAALRRSRASGRR